MSSFSTLAKLDADDELNDTITNSPLRSTKTKTYTNSPLPSTKTLTRPEPLICVTKGCTFKRTVTCKGGRLRKQCFTCLDNEWNQGKSATDIDEADLLRGKGKRKRSTTFKLVDT